VGRRCKLGHLPFSKENSQQRRRGKKSNYKLGERGIQTRQNPRTSTKMAHLNST